MLDWLDVTEVKGISKTCAEHYGGKILKFGKNLSIWRESGVVKTRTIQTSKLQDRGVTIISVRYNLNMGSIYIACGM